MLSVSTALMEFPGLRILPILLKELKSLRASALTMLLLIISWGIYLGGIIRLAVIKTELSMSGSTVINLISGTWILMA